MGYFYMGRLHEGFCNLQLATCNLQILQLERHHEIAYEIACVISPLRVDYTCILDVRFKCAFHCHMRFLCHFQSKQELNSSKTSGDKIERLRGKISHNLTIRHKWLNLMLFKK
jgi:hypothetical protein